MITPVVKVDPCWKSPGYPSVATSSPVLAGRLLRNLTWGNSSIRLNTKQGQVRGFVPGNQFGSCFELARPLHGQFTAAMHHVVVAQHMSHFGYKKPGAGRLHARFVRHGFTARTLRDSPRRTGRSVSHARRHHRVPGSQPRHGRCHTPGCRHGSTDVNPDGRHCNAIRRLASGPQAWCPRIRYRHRNASHWRRGRPRSGVRNYSHSVTKPLQSSGASMDKL